MSAYHPFYLITIDGAASSRYSLYEASQKEWEDILELAYLWRFPEVKALALRELDAFDMTLVNRVVMYSRFQAPTQILVALLGQLCMRDATLSMQEVTQLGWDRAGKVLYVRDWVHSPPSEISEGEMLDRIVELFGLEEYHDV